MGGRGALYLGMKYPDVFGAIYGLSSGTMNFGEVYQRDVPEPEWLSKLLQLQDIRQAELEMWWMIGRAAAFSPNPDRPPFLVDLPYELVDGTVRPLPEVFKKWQAYDPVALVSSSEMNLRKLKAIRFDCGKSDGVINNSRSLAKALSAVRIPHIFEEYGGTHGNRIHERIETKVLPFFSEVLAFAVSSK
jgi:S-formylglutathione hydrolase FrmB